MLMPDADQGGGNYNSGYGAASTSKTSGSTSSSSGGSASTSAGTGDTRGDSGAGVGASGSASGSSSSQSASESKTSAPSGTSQSKPSTSAGPNRGLASPSQTSNSTAKSSAPPGSSQSKPASSTASNNTPATSGGTKVSDPSRPGSTPSPTSAPGKTGISAPGQPGATPTLNTADDIKQSMENLNATMNTLREAIMGGIAAPGPLSPGAQMASPLGDMPAAQTSMRPPMSGVGQQPAGLAAGPVGTTLANYAPAAPKIADRVPNGMPATAGTGLSAMASAAATAAPPAAPPAPRQIASGPWPGQSAVPPNPAVYGEPRIAYQPPSWPGQNAIPPSSPPVYSGPAAAPPAMPAPPQVADYDPLSSMRPAAPPTPPQPSRVVSGPWPGMDTRTYNPATYSPGMPAPAAPPSPQIASYDPLSSVSVPAPSPQAVTGMPGGYGVPGYDSPGSPGFGPPAGPSRATGINAPEEEERIVSIEDFPEPPMPGMPPPVEVAYDPPPGEPYAEAPYTPGPYTPAQPPAPRQPSALERLASIFTGDLGGLFDGLSFDGFSPYDAPTGWDRPGGPERPLQPTPGGVENRPLVARREPNLDQLRLILSTFV